MMPVKRGYPLLVVFFIREEIIVAKLQYFKICNLFNQYNVLLNFEKEVNVFVGENGMGKTTILNCLYYVLSGRLDKLDGILFSSIAIKFDISEEITLTQSDLNAYLEENVYNSLRYRRMHRNNLDNIFSEKEKDELKKLAQERDVGIDELMGYAVRVGEIYGLPIRVAYDELRRYISSLYQINGSGKVSNAIDFKNKVEKLVEEDVLYYPTYRRIEEDMSKLGVDMDRDNVKERLIQFGMKDVENRINKVLETIKVASINGFTKMTGVLLKQYLNHVEIGQKGKIDQEKLNIALDRIGDEIENSDKEKIKEIVDSGDIYRSENQHLFNLIVNLISSYERQNTHDEKIRKYRDVCNAYFDGKKYIYDESNVKLEIYRNNYRKNISIQNLSSGEKQVLSIFSKLYLEQQKSCIILFDEPELSLSISWQEHFLPDIMKSGKCSLLVAVTHSPFIFDNEYDSLAQDMGSCIEEVVGESNDGCTRCARG